MMQNKILTRLVNQLTTITYCKQLQKNQYLRLRFCTTSGQNQKKYANAYEEHWQRSIDPQTREQFWKEQSQLLDWYKDPQEILNKSHDNPGFWRWFNDGKINITYNCLDRHVKTQPDAPAIHYYSSMVNKEQTYSYKEVLDQVSRLSTVYTDLGVKKGDRIIIYMPLIPEAIFAMLASARIGAVHSVVFGGFASHELANRIQDCQASLIVSASCGVEPGNKIVQYKDLLDEAIEFSKYKGKTIIVQREVHRNEHMVENRDLDYHELMSKTHKKTDPVPVKGTDPHYILYTSGSTGAPKGIVRDQGGTSVALAYAMKYIMNVGKGGTYFAASDIGWVVGHSFICYAPLISGSATVLYEGKPVGTPDASIYWKLVQKYKINGLFTAPTAIRAIRKDDPDGNFLKQFDLSSLNCLHIAGERLDINTAQWLESHVNGIPINDNFWQTETGWPIATNFLNLKWFDNVPFGSAGKPVPGYDIQILDDDNKKIEEPNKLGRICIKLPMPPSFMQTIWRNDPLYIQKYLLDSPGYYLAGDAGYFDQAGCLNIMTRIDDTINTAGHRLSTGQIEECLLHHDQVVEAAVVAQNDELKGEIPIGFIVLSNAENKSEDQIEKECAKTVREYLGPVAFFRHCLVVKKLPKTRSGKVLRHLLHKMINDIPIESTPPTIEDASVVPEIQKIVEQYKQTHVY